MTNEGILVWSDGRREATMAAGPKIVTITKVEPVGDGTWRETKFDAQDETNDGKRVYRERMSTQPERSDEP